MKTMLFIYLTGVTVDAMAILIYNKRFAQYSTQKEGACALFSWLSFIGTAAFILNDSLKK